MNEVTRITLKYLDGLDFIDEDLKKLTYIYFESYVQYTVSYRNKLIPLLNILKTCDKNTFYWSNYRKLLINSNVSKRQLIYFILYLSSSEYLEKPLSNEYQQVSAHFQNAINKNSLFQPSVIEKMRYIDSLYVGEYYEKGIKCYSSFVININSPIIHSLLNDFINANTSVLKNNKKFFEVFEDSIFDKSKFELITSFKDFTFEVFTEQFEFYDKLDLSNILCSFYLFLWGMDPNYDLFPLSSGVNYQTMKRKEFYKDFKAGYKLVMYNPFDPVPLFNKWIIHYNGYGNNNLLAN